MVADIAAFFFGEGFLQRAALIHGGGGNHAAGVADGLHAGKFSRGELHGLSPSLWPDIVNDAARWHEDANVRIAGRSPALLEKLMRKVLTLALTLVVVAFGNAQTQPAAPA